MIFLHLWLLPFFEKYLREFAFVLLILSLRMGGCNQTCDVVYVSSHQRNLGSNFIQIGKRDAPWQIQKVEIPVVNQ